MVAPSESSPQPDDRRQSFVARMRGWLGRSWQDYGKTQARNHGLPVSNEPTLPPNPAPLQPNVVDRLDVEMLFSNDRLCPADIVKLMKD